MHTPTLWWSAPDIQELIQEVIQLGEAVHVILWEGFNDSTETWTRKITLGYKIYGHKQTHTHKYCEYDKYYLLNTAVH